MAVHYGSKRTTTGAHYGTRDWLAQRITAALMVVFTLLVFGQLLLAQGETTYTRWAGIFAPQWMKSITVVVIFALLYHVWVGMRDIWMDYIQPTGIRLFLHVFTLVWLLACGAWAVQSLWSF